MVGDGRWLKCVLETPGSGQVWCDGGKGLGVQESLEIQGGSKLPSVGEETFCGC